VHDCDDHDLGGGGVDAINNAVGETVQSTTAISFVERLPGTGMRNDQVQAATIFVDEFDTEARPSLLIVLERTFQVGLRLVEDDGCHWWALALRRSIT
jgi:hypothetical protein